MVSARVPADLLRSLAECPERELFYTIVCVRVVFVLYMLFCTHVLPLLFYRPPSFLVFDSGEWLYEDSRFTGVRNWDAVHFFHIAHHGYSHENLHVFFPLIPLLIRATEFVVVRLLPFLSWMAPVSLYLCAINIVASAAAGLVLRRLTLLTLLGPEAHDLVSRWLPSARVGEQGKDDLSSSSDACLRAAITYRVQHELQGTIVDTMPQLRALAPAAAKDQEADSTISSPTHSSREESFAWHVVGAAVLLWTITPCMVFTVAVYTESIFSLLSFAGVYALARYPAAARRAPPPLGAGSAAASPAVWTFPFPPSHRPAPGGVAAEGPEVRWQQACTSKGELTAVLCFSVAAMARSNAFVCAGFLLYPTFIRVCCRQLYEKRWSNIHGYVLARLCESGEAVDPLAAGSPPPFSSSSSRAHGKTARRAGPRVILTLHPPHGRVPGVLRCLVLVAELALILAPYTVMNYVGWRNFVKFWAAEEQAAIGHRFWKLYGTLQKKYWNVGFLSAYTVVNSPNVVIGLPVGLIIVWTSWVFYVRPAWREGARRQPSAPRSLAPLLQSANVVYLCALCAIAFTMMHVQVANRFLMSCPALYWVGAEQIVRHPRSRISKGILLFSVVWALAGGMLFPNHLPWT